MDSSRWADEILMVDGGSTDATPDIAREEYGATVYTRPYDFSSHQYNYITARAETDWVFVLDSDEVISPELAEEIRSVIGGSPDYDIYRVPRKLIDHGRWLRCCRTWPDYCVRLYRPGKFVFQLDRVHAGGWPKGPYGTLEESIIHYSFDDFADHLERANTFTTWSALEYYDRGKNPGWLSMFLRFGGTFWREFLQGVPGLMYCVIRATEVFAKYAKVWELHDGSSSLDIEAEQKKKLRAAKDILSDPEQPDLLRELYPDLAPDKDESE